MTDGQIRRAYDFLDEGMFLNDDHKEYIKQVIACQNDEIKKYKSISFSEVLAEVYNSCADHMRGKLSNERILESATKIYIELRRVL